MTKVTYEIVEHDGGWAYRVDGVFSETFPTHDAARRAAERAANEQVVAGETTAISWEDKEGRWHDEIASGKDRPETDVEG
jgi:type II secretory pathway component HofQ